MPLPYGQEVSYHPPHVLSQIANQIGMGIQTSGIPSTQEGLHGQHQTKSPCSEENSPELR